LNIIPTVEKKGFVLLSVTVVLGVALLVTIIFSFSNISSRFYQLADVTRYISGTAILENKQTLMMSKYQNLQRLIKELSQDTEDRSYNSRVGIMLEKLQEFQIELKEVEYGKENNNGQIYFLPVKLELFSNFDKTIKFISYIENEPSVMGLAKLELMTSGATSTDIEIKAVINFYRMGS